MNEWKNRLIKNIRVFLEEKGIDPLYAATVFVFLITLTYWKDFRNWENTPSWRKGLAKATIFGTFVLLFLSILRMLGKL